MHQLFLVSFVGLAYSYQIKPHLRILRKATYLAASESQPYEALQSFGSTLLEPLFKEYDLKTTDYTDSLGTSKWLSQSNEIFGESFWFDENRGSKLTGISFALYNTPSHQSLSLSGWLGPTSSVPHFKISINSYKAEDNQCIYHLSADYIARGAQAIGTDLTYFNTYYDNSNMKNKYKSINELNNMHAIDANYDNFFERVLKSPNCIDIHSDSRESVEEFCIEHVRQWMEWIKNATPVETRARGAMNARDDKLRQFFFASNLYRAQRAFQGELSPDFIKSVAAGWTGPISEAYIGGGS